MLTLFVALVYAGIRVKLLFSLDDPFNLGVFIAFNPMCHKNVLSCSSAHPFFLIDGCGTLYKGYVKVRLDGKIERNR